MGNSTVTHPAPVAHALVTQVLDDEMAVPFHSSRYWPYYQTILSPLLSALLYFKYFSHRILQLH